LISVSLGMVPRGYASRRRVHAGEARAKAAIASRRAARTQSRAAGQADAMAILMRRTLPNPPPVDMDKLKLTGCTTWGVWSPEF
jgi:hypothetical protein